MQPKIFSADEHDIDPSHIDADAITVLKKLTEAGHIAYLVGGGVRDLLVNKRPKDFDISTSASPEEIKRIFQRSCLLIGRRFRLAHIRFGQKVIEVSTFRSGESSDELIVRDNQWGTPEEDVRRRDFTINGLFLDPTHHQIIDYVGGWEDIHRGVLRTIGDPTMRFRQDPVRMIRLLKFSSRFPFQIDPGTYQALLDCRSEILKSAPARVLEELLRMLESGASKEFFEQMLNTGLLEFLLPWLAKFLKGPAGDQVYKLLEQADLVMRTEGLPLDRAVVSSCLLFPILDRELHIQFHNKESPANMGDISVVTHALIRGVGANSFPAFTKRLKWSWGFILSTQYRLVPLNMKTQPRSRLLRHPDFPLALSLLRLRSMLDPLLKPLFDEWSLLDQQNKPHRPESRDESEMEEGQIKTRRRRPYRNRPPAHHRPAHGHR